MKTSIKLNVFIAVLVFSILFFIQTKAFAATTQIIAIISPVRYVYLDSSKNIVRIDSNSSSSIDVQLYWVDQSGKPLNSTEDEKINYNSLIKNIDLTKTGTVYIKHAPSKMNQFFFRLESKLPIFSKLFLF